MRSLIALSLITIFAFVCRPNVSRADTVPVIHLCQGDSEIPWHRNVLSSLDRLYYAGYERVGEKRFEVVTDKSSDCIKRAAGACFGEKGAIYCDERVLARALHIIAWRASAWAIDTVFHKTEHNGSIPAYFTLNLLLTVAFVDTIERHGSPEQLGKQAWLFMQEGVSVDDLMRTARTLANLRIRDATVLPQSPETEAEYHAYVMYEAVANYVFAYVIGHELAHAYTHCIFQTPSKVESSGLVEQLELLQTGGNELCANPLFIDESEADKCALRATEAVDYEMVLFKQEYYKAEGMFVKPQHMLDVLSISRVLAIDIMSWFLTIGLSVNFSDSVSLAKERDGELPLVDILIPRRRGYYYGALRLLLFSTELARLEPWLKQKVRLCSISAEMFALGLRNTLQVCRNLKNAGDLATIEKPFAALFGEFVPSGLKNIWSQGGLNNGIDRDIFQCP